MKHALLVAYHFPPMAASSGIQRTLAFARYLPAYGWKPLILSTHPRAYEVRDDQHIRNLPADLHVERAFALDTARHLSLFGRYPGMLARPDRWISWWLGALWTGLRMIRRFKPDVIWTTYPIATAHVIGASLSRISGLPWIADFRDPMAQDGYPVDPKTWASFSRIEQRTIQRADHSVFVSAGALRFYRNRYPEVPASRFSVLENGFDDEAFRSVESTLGERVPLNPGAVTLLHSGVVYPSERDPTQLINAVRALSERAVVSGASFKIRFRAAAHDDLLSRLACDAGVESMIEILPAIPYGEALTEMLRADALLVLQAANCNDQVPAKLYEYARSGRPVLGLTDPSGDTATAMHKLGLNNIQPLDSAPAIENGIEQLLVAVARHEASGADQIATSTFSRQGQTARLAALFDAVAR